MQGSSDYDQRQYKQMLSTLDAYERQEFTLRMLVNRLEALLTALQDAPVEWQDSFQRNWGMLETAYALEQERKVPQISGEDLNAISEAIQGLRGLLAEAIK